MTTMLEKIHNQPAFKTFLRHCDLTQTGQTASSAKKASTENSKCKLSQAICTNKPACWTMRTTRICSWKFFWASAPHHRLEGSVNKILLGKLRVKTRRHQKYPPSIWDCCSCVDWFCHHHRWLFCIFTASEDAASNAATTVPAILLPLHHLLVMPLVSFCSWFILFYSWSCCIMHSNCCCHAIVAVPQLRVAMQPVGRAEMWMILGGIPTMAGKMPDLDGFAWMFFLDVNVVVHVLVLINDILFVLDPSDATPPPAVVSSNRALMYVESYSKGPSLSPSSWSCSTSQYCSKQWMILRMPLIVISKSCRLCP